MKIIVNQIRGVKLCDNAQPFEVYVSSVVFNRSNSSIAVNETLDYQHNEKLITNKVMEFDDVTDITPLAFTVEARYHDSVERRDKSPTRPWPVIVRQNGRPEAGLVQEVLIDVTMQNMTKTVRYRISYDIFP